MAFNINQRLNGLHSLSYMGDNAVQPPDFVTKQRPPTLNDSKNFALGDIWLDTTGYPGILPGAENVYMLVALVGNQATWVNFSGGNALETLTGNSGGAVSGDGNDNINILGDTTTINVVGNPVTNTLTISTVGTGVISKLTGNSGGAVSPTAGNINVLGTGVITVVGTPGTSTLTVTPSGAIASSFITNPATGTATPVAGVLTIAGTNAITASAAGSTVTVGITNYVENGTFTPTLRFGGSSTGITYEVQIGKYTRLNSLVLFTILIKLTNKGAQVGQAQIHGMPTTFSTGGAFTVRSSDITFGGFLQAIFDSGSRADPLIDLESVTGIANANFVYLDDTSFSNTSIIDVSGYYIV